MLKIFDSCVLNIELKTEMISVEQITKQLISCKHYLSHLAKPIYNFTYVSETRDIYMLNNNDLVIKSDIQSIIDVLLISSNPFTDDIATLFRASNFLTSPINTPEKFLSGNYFLTSQQSEFKKKIYASFSSTNISLVSGAAGTGKTLLLYDLALYSPYQKVLVIHCGLLSDGHKYIDAKSKLNIKPVKSFK